MEKEVLKILKDLFKPVNESLELMQRIDKKLDIQASSKLRGQLETLELLISSKKKEQTSFKICLGNLNESIEYYRSLTEQTIKEFGDIYGNHKIRSLLVDTPKYWLKFGRKSMQKEVLCCARILDYASLWCLSEAAAIICLVKLKYTSQIIEEHEYRLARAFVRVMNFIIREAMEMVVLVDSSCSHGLKEPERLKISGALHDRLVAGLYAHLAGKNALQCLIKGLDNFLNIDSLIPDLSNIPELNDLSYSMPHGSIANKAFERDRENRWHEFLGGSKQR
ncbi:hypothetical protein KA005_85720 [bacterium]|nr:hypothetical protein [bacterium]